MFYRYARSYVTRNSCPSLPQGRDISDPTPRRWSSLTMVSCPFVRSLQEDSSMSSEDFARDLKSSSIQFCKPRPSRSPLCADLVVVQFDLVVAAVYDRRF